MSEEEPLVVPTNINCKTFSDVPTPAPTEAEVLREALKMAVRELSDCDHCTHDEQEFIEEARASLARKDKP